MLIARPMPSTRISRDHLLAVDRKVIHAMAMPSGRTAGRNASTQPSPLCPVLKTAAAWLSAQAVANHPVNPLTAARIMPATTPASRRQAAVDPESSILTILPSIAFNKHGHWAQRMLARHQPSDSPGLRYFRPCQMRARRRAISCAAEQARAPYVPDNADYEPHACLRVPHPCVPKRPFADFKYRSMIRS